MEAWKVRLPLQDGQEDIPAETEKPVLLSPDKHCNIAPEVVEWDLLHALLKARGLLPEEPLPGGEVGALEQGVLQDALHSSQSLDDICPVVVQVPQLAVMALVRPPEGVLLEHLVLLEVSAHAPALVICQSVPVLLEQGVDPGHSPVPGVLQVL